MVLSPIAIVLLIVVILLLCGALGPLRADYGYGPGGILGVLLIILIVLILMGRL